MDKFMVIMASHSRFDFFPTYFKENAPFLREFKGISLFLVKNALFLILGSYVAQHNPQWASKLVIFVIL